MNAEEIIESLKELDTSAYEFVQEVGGEYFSEEYLEEEDKEIFKKLGKIERASVSINNDMNEEVVLYFADHNVYLKWESIYNSYESIQEFEDIGDCTEVFPKEVKTIIYE